MMLNTRYTKKEFEKLLTEKLFNEFAIDIASATDEQIYRALALIARGMLLSLIHIWIMFPATVCALFLFCEFFGRLRNSPSFIAHLI